MAYFAQVKDGIVVKVVTIEQETIDTGQFGDPSTWVQTSYNTCRGVHYDPETNEPSPDQSKALRKNYAGVGYTYDSVRDAFIPPQPAEDWTLNEDECWWYPPEETSP
jgi:hypothetical protein